jgi:hypothetical protein
MRRLLPCLLALIVLACLPAAAPAAIVPGQAIDGPSTDIKTFGDIDMAPDGTGGLVYLKAIAGVNHVFVSTYSNGVWRNPQQVDTAPIIQTNNSRWPRIAAANGGRLIVTFVSGNGPTGSVESEIVNPDVGITHTQIEGGTIATLADVDMNPAGIAYVVYNNTSGTSMGGGDVLAARVVGTTRTPVGAGALDATVADMAAENGQSGPRVGVTDDGNATMAWTESPTAGVYHVYARSLTGTTPGAAALADLATIPGSDGTSDISDMVDVDAAGSGPAWVVFRQQFKYGAFNVPHAIARPLPSGGAFGTGQVVDGLPSGKVQGAEFPRVDVNPGGQGMLGAARQDLNETGQNDVLGSTLAGGTWATGFRVDSIDNDTDVPTPVVAVGDDGGGAWAWHEHVDATTEEVRVRQRSAAGALQGEAIVSNPAFGTAGEIDLEASADAAGRIVVGFTQGGGVTKRIVAAVVDPIAAGGGGGGGGGGGVVDNIAPKLSSVSLTRSVFRLGSLLPKLSAVRKRTIPTGTTIRFRVDEDSKTTLSFKRVLPGRRVGRRCLKATRARRRLPRCTRLVPAGRKLTYTTKKGLRRVRFQGRFSRTRKLVPGRYELTIVAVDAAKNASKPARKRFTLKAALKRKRR